MRKASERLHGILTHLANDEDIIAQLEAALGGGDPAVIVSAIGSIARARGMTRVARDAGLGRTNLYRALSPEGNPEFATVLKVVKALGIRLRVDTA
jgi:probable addiction module antidote protein